MSEEKITQWFINNINGTPSEEQLALRKVYEQQQEIERMENLNNQLVEECQKLDDEVTKLQNIIKETREIFKYYGDKKDIVGYSNYTITGEDLIKLLEMLDKENK